MNILIKNEMLKLKRIKSVIVIVLLSLFPYLINTIGLLSMRSDTDYDRYYFFVFNQNAILFPTIIFIFTGYVFYLEFKNRTMLNWISYPFNNFKLLLSKMLTIFIFLFFVAFLTHLIHLSTLWASYSGEIKPFEIINLFLGSLSFSTLSLLMIPVAALIAFVTRNLVTVIIIGVASIFVTTMLLGADFSIAYPFAYIYRLSIQFFDPTFGYPSVSFTLWGALILVCYVLIPGLLLYRAAQNPRIN
ncbi:ABC transporter permease [Paenibacillus sp. L3-i20]|uniref:ABC transporter permease n=1 Tax=Paenibacillus sp. L3-i20 TaxID=2905833 RepID=UPI001EDDEB9F|nr:ABC transporter permease [Paenibacillus sp. L3-i20]GKU76395.1 hypothetical protein L3i20_v207920 [Paenibacillus sp. L3-i20]